MKFKSESMINGSPEWELDTDSCTVTHRTADGKVSEDTFHTDYIRYHISYTVAKYPERFKRLVNKGEIYKYLDDLETRALEAESRQVEKWKENDREYKAAVMAGDIMKAAGLENGLKYMAREIVLDCMIYV